MCSPAGGPAGLWLPCGCSCACSRGCSCARVQLHLQLHLYLCYAFYAAMPAADLLTKQQHPSAEAGVRGAKSAARRVARLSPTPELLVVSPLSRALHTAALAFGENPGGCAW